MKYCPKCHKQFSDEMDFCPHDGTELILDETSDSFKRVEAMRKEQETLEKKEKFRNAVTTTEKIIYLTFPFLYIIALFLPIVYYYETVDGVTSEVIVSGMTFLLSIFTDTIRPTFGNIFKIVLVSLALAIVLIGGIVSIIMNATSSISKDDPAKSKFALLTGFGYFTLAYALRATICGKVGNNPGMSDAPYNSAFGGMFYILFFLTLAAVIAVFILRLIRSKQEITHRTIMTLIFKFLSFVFSIYLTNAIMGCILEDAVNGGEFNYLLLSDLTPDNGTIDFLLVFSILFVMYTMLASFLKIYHPLENVSLSITVSCVQAYLGIMLYILTYVLLNSTADGKSYIFSENFYSMLPVVIFTFLLALVGDILTLSKQNEIKEKNKSLNDTKQN